MAFNANNYVKDLSMAELNDIIEWGANLATYDERVAAKQAAKARLSSMRGDPVYGGAGADGGLREGGGTWNGVYSDGSSQPWYGGTPSRGTAGIPIPADATPALPGGPGVQDPSAPGVIDWGGANQPPAAPPPAGGGSYVPPTNGMDPNGGQIGAPDPFQPPGGVEAPSMEWDWGRFGEQTPTGGFGQYFQQYDASARYSPGEDASWGSDKFPGNNRDFYQNQFANLIRQEQGFQAAQRQAANQYEQGQNQQPLPLDWSWIEGGLPEITQTESGYALPRPGMEFEQNGYNSGNAPAYFYDPFLGAWQENGNFGGGRPYVPTPGGGGGPVENGSKLV